MSVKRNQRPIEIDGQVYGSMSEASKALNIPYPTIQTRLLSKKERFSGWKYADGKPAPDGRKTPISKYPKVVGCYEFKNKITGAFYFGSASDVKGRKGAHLFKLRRGIHTNKEFQKEWNRYNEDDWDFKIFMTHDREQAFQIEQMWISQNANNPKMLNSSKDARSPLHGNDKTNLKRKTLEEKMVESAQALEEYEKRKQENSDYYIQRRGDFFLKPVIIDGMRYSSVTLARHVTGLDHKKIKRRVRSKDERFNGYSWAKPEESDLMGIVRKAKSDDYLDLGDELMPKQVPKVPGLIIVRHLPTGKVYVGGSVNVYRVVNEEEKRLRRGKHDNSELQALYDTQGKEIDVSVIELEPGTDVKTAKQSKIMEIGPGLCCNKVLRYNI